MNVPADPELARQQQQFRQAVLAAGQTVDAEADPVAAGLLRQPPGRPALLRIYQHAYISRLAGALRDNFGCLPQVMGDEAFEALASAYVQAQPSRHPSIRWFGHGLADHMAANEALVPHPALIDLARMEWALRAAFDALDAPVLAPAALAEVPPHAWGELVLAFHPSLQLLELQWRIEPIWRAFQNLPEGEEPELPEPEAEAHALLVWRPALETRWRSAHSELEAELLRAAVQGESFGSLCERAAAAVGVAQAAATAASVLQQWVGEGLLTGWRL